MKKSIFILALVIWTAPDIFAQQKETRDLATFNKISYTISGAVYLRQGDTQKVVLEGDADVLEKIETEVNGGKLTIGSKEKWYNWRGWNDKKVTVYITVKNLEALNLSGSGKLIGETRFTTNDFNLKVSGSGDVELEIAASGDLETSLSGSGKIMLKGKCSDLKSDVSGSGKVNLDLKVGGTADFGISGSGKIEATGSSQKVRVSIGGSGKLSGADFETHVCDVRISGSGNVEINVKDELDANISGSGSVAYRGNPGKVNSNSSGSGKVRKM